MDASPQRRDGFILSVGSAVGTSSIGSRRHQPSCRVPLTTPLAHRQSPWPGRAGTRRGLSSLQFTKKVTIISVVTEADPSDANGTTSEHPSETTAVMLDSCLFFRSSEDREALTGHPELTAALKIPQTQHLARVAVATVVWQSQGPTKQTGQKTVGVQRLSISIELQMFLSYCPSRHK